MNNVVTNKFGVATKTTEMVEGEELEAIKVFLDGVPTDAMMNAVIETLRDRTPDGFDAQRLTNYSNEIGRIAWAAI